MRIKREKMLLLIFVILPALLLAETELEINDYTIKIDEDTLKSIQAKTNASDELNLSNLGLRALAKDVFDGLTNLKSLKLANNSLTTLPEFVFSNLTNLEYISLADNEISVFNNFFVGLKNLKCLNISMNPLKHLGKGWLFGLTESSQVITQGNSIQIISTGLFENPFVRENNITEIPTKNLHPRDRLFSIAELQNSTVKATDLLNPNKFLNESLRLKVCIEKGKVNALEVLKDNESLTSGCRQVIPDRILRKVSLRGLFISGFERGWYRLQDYPISFIDLEGNEIVRLTSELLNDLPQGLNMVSLRGNRIERLEKGIIVNDHLNTLDLGDNVIREIEVGALEMTDLKEFLFLDGNRLEDTKFAATLPAKITELYLQKNLISEIPAGSFSKLSKLSKLELDDNRITQLRKKSFDGLPSLRYLSLTNNRLNVIEPGAFEDLSFLRILDLGNNSMSSLQEGLFDGIDILLTLSISANNFSRINKDTMAGLPYTVHNLVLDSNAIETLEAGAFRNVPILSLSLDTNKISKIERATFYLPTLRHLSLKNNSLSDVDGDSFEGLKNLKTLSLAGNNIKNIRKGFAKNLGNIQILDLTRNPIEKLEKGALYGLEKSERNIMYIIDTPLQLIEGGLFDDV